MQSSIEDQLDKENNSLNFLISDLVAAIEVLRSKRIVTSKDLKKLIEKRNISSERASAIFFHPATTLIVENT